MVDLTCAKAQLLAVHRVGNKTRGQDLHLSPMCHPLGDNAHMIEDFLLSPMRSEEWYRFKVRSSAPPLYESFRVPHIIDGLSQAVFKATNQDIFLNASQTLAKALYDSSTHPHISSGELYVCLFREAHVNGVECNALGIFKSEKKKTYVKTDSSSTEDDPLGEEVKVKFDMGMPLNGMDKGCLIFDQHANDGYRVLIYDRNTVDTTFWRHDFLNLERVEDEIHTTQHTMELLAQFGEDIVERDHGPIAKHSYFKDCLQYFNNEDVFDASDFFYQVVLEGGMHESITNFFDAVKDETGFKLETFSISKYAVKNMQKRFKPVIKLDTQVTLNLHKKHVDLALDHMERGYDEERGQHYYKVYFNEEVS